MAALPEDAEKLLAVSPEEFVEQRTLLVRRVREEGRSEDAQAVARMKKPPPVVLAVNRAARDRPQAAKDAAGAAERLGPAQLSGGAAEYQGALKEMEQASALLAEVAVANLSKGKSASDHTRRRVAELIRGALGAEETRQQLIRGVLTAEVEAQGFDAFRGLPMPAQALQRERSKPSKSSLEKRRGREELEAAIEETARLLKDAEQRYVLAVHEVLPTRHRLPLLVLDATGMRLGELQALRWGDVDEPRGRWRVSRTVSKTGQGRWVSVPPAVFDAVLDLVPREDRTPERKVFQGFSGDSFRTAVSRACTAAGVPTFSPHDLRHRRISLLHLGGVPWARIGEHVGQRNLAVTANTYSHVLVDEAELEYAALLR